MPKKKVENENLIINPQTVSQIVSSSHEVLRREQLKTYLARKLPTMFDRDPVITGNLDLLVDEILSI